MKPEYRKLETHAHTAETSACSHLPAEQLVQLYVDGGYGAIQITDHLHPGFFPELDEKARADKYLSGYRAARAQGERLGIAVLFGIEVTLQQGSEDYLVMGAGEEDVPRLFELCGGAALSDFFSELDARGFLVVQAHPFRPHQDPMPHAFLHGIEVYNGNPRHDARNHLAYEYARRGGASFIRLGGSDAHQLEDIGRGGILAPEWVRTGGDLVAYLKETPHPPLIRA